MEGPKECKIVCSETGTEIATISCTGDGIKITPTEDGKKMFCKDSKSECCE